MKPAAAIDQLRPHRFQDPVIQAGQNGPLRTRMGGCCGGQPLHVRLGHTLCTLRLNQPK